MRILWMKTFSRNYSNFSSSKLDMLKINVKGGIVICGLLVKTVMTPGRMNKRPFTVCIEGNIGSGKTTFLSHFKRFNNTTVLEEPVQLWRNVAGTNLLDLLYKNPQRYSFLFQSYVQLTMLQLHTMQVDRPYKVMERSVYSARCFIENMKRTRLLLNVEAMVLENWYEWCVKSANIETDLIVYLRTDPEVVFQRMRARGRKEEDSVSLEYLKQIHQVHDDWLYYKNLFAVPAPVMVLNGNKSLEEMIHQFEECKEQIYNCQIENQVNSTRSPITLLPRSLIDVKAGATK